MSDTGDHVRPSPPDEHRRLRRLPLRTATLLLLCLLVACGRGGGGPGGATDRDAISGEVIVFAAASLTDVFADLGATFERTHPGATVVFNFGPSSGLAASITEGAPADVFAAADERAMDRVADAGELDGLPVTFARNRMAMAVPPGNPGEVDGLEDLADPERLVGLCAENVPCGHLGRMVLADAGVRAQVDTEEPDVRALLTKIEAGDLDVGLVYRTDVQAAGTRVEGIAIADDDNASTSYPVAVPAGSENPGAAAAFVDLVTSAEGRRVLRRHGFGAP